MYEVTLPATFADHVANDTISSQHQIGTSASQMSRTKKDVEESKSQLGVLQPATIGVLFGCMKLCESAFRIQLGESTLIERSS